MDSYSQENTGSSIPHLFCSSLRSNGERCRAKALPGKRYCSAHDGAPRVMPAPGELIPLSTRADVLSLLQSTTQKVLSGQVAAATGSAVAALSSALLEIIESDEYDTWNNAGSTHD